MTHTPGRRRGRAVRADGGIDEDRLEAVRGDVRALHDYLTDRARRSVAAVAYSVDGRTFEYESPCRSRSRSAATSGCRRRAGRRTSDRWSRRPSSTGRARSWGSNWTCATGTSCRRA
ncbi:hypothetical protein ACFQRB_14060 [Halobaculum litoreum]|uniref:Uncharacterized protein n=1 Tax=Halobaculum litoreum TaxID=3031998 RepID=A0ABD5XUU6_9EURY